MSFSALIAAADRAVLLNLGGPVRYAAAGAAPVDVVGIFDATYVRLDAGEAGMSSSGPAVFLKLSDLPSDPEEDDASVTVEGVDYVVKETKKDGLGGVMLMLREA